MPLLLWFARGWLAIAIAVNLVAVVGILAGFAGFSWQRVAEVYRTYWLLEVAWLLPAIGAYTWLQRRLSKELLGRSRPENSHQ